MPTSCSTATSTNVPRSGTNERGKNGIPGDLFADAREGPPSRSSFEALRCLLDVQPTEHMVDITRIRVRASHQGIILTCTRQVVHR